MPRACRFVCILDLFQMLGGRRLDLGKRRYSRLAASLVLH